MPEGVNLLKSKTSLQYGWALATVGGAVAGLFLIAVPGSSLPLEPPAAQVFGPPGSTTNPSGNVGKPETSDPFQPFPDLVLPGRGVAYPSSRAGNNPGVVVNTATGNLHLSYTDVVVPGRGFPFRFTRSYNSLDTYSGPLGLGWTHTYNVFLVEDSTGMVTVKEADGHQSVFSPTGGGYYAPATPGDFDILRKAASFVLTRRNQTQFTFNLAGKLTRITDRNGNHQDLSYTSGHLAVVTDTSGRPFTFAYDSSNHLTSLTDPAGRVYAYSYNAGSLAFSTDPQGGTTSYTYTGGKLGLLMDPRDIALFQINYDAAGRVIRWVDANGVPITFSYDQGTAAVTRITDRRGKVTTHFHDSGRRLVKVTDALNGNTSYQYDANNERTSVTNALGNTTSYTYDARGNRTSITDPLGNVTSFTYDSKNNPLTRTTPLGFTTSYSYDANGNRISIRDPLGNTSRMGYDAFGQLTTSTDPNNHSTRYSYDSNGNLVSVTDARGNVTLYTYDAAGNPATFTNARGKQTSYSYNDLNRLVGVVNPLSQNVGYGYDEKGKLISRDDANGNFKQYNYNAAGVLSEIGLFSNGSDTQSRVSYSYDANGNRTVMDDNSGHVTSYTYDALNRVTSIAQPSFVPTTEPPPYPTDPTVPRYTTVPTAAPYTTLASRIISYSYDAVGNRTQLTYPDGKTVRYSYDGANRLISVSDWQSLVTSYSYDKDGHITMISYPNGTSSAILWDAAGRVLTVRNVTLTSSGPIASIFKYILDPAGNRLRATDALGTLNTYTYNERNELISTQNNIGTTSLDYDAGGNRIKRTMPDGSVINYTYDDADRLISAGPETYSYDENGNQIGKLTGRTLVSYAYDSRDRLISVNGPGVSETFTYDGDGNRVVRTAGNVTTEYINDISVPVVVPLQELSGGTTTSFVRGNGSIISEFNDSQPSNFYHHLDAQGSTVGISNSLGRLVQIGVYNAWGEMSTSNNLGLSGEFRYIGESFDPLSGFYYMRARYYDPRLGRFISQDPYTGQLNVPLSRNRYIYARNNPQRFTDRIGFDVFDGFDFDNFFPPAADDSADSFPLPPPPFDPEF
jgi:RHS repeat-associated protein